MQVTVAIMAMNNILGLWPTLTGFSAVVVVAPVATILGTLAQRVRKTLITRTDVRVDLVTEMLSSALPSGSLSLLWFDIMVLTPSSFAVSSASCFTVQ